MVIDLYTAKNYKDYVRKLLDSSLFGRGGRTRLATHLQIPNSQVSGILNGSEDFTLEQAMKLSEFFSLSKSETHFFMLMVERDRAGTLKLKEYYESQMQRILEKKQEVKSRVTAESMDESENESVTLKYFQHWYTVAIHRAIRAYPTADSRLLAETLRLDPNTVRTALEFLETNGFIAKERGKWVDHQARAHIGKNSIALQMHHTHWRMQTIRALEAPLADDLHYTLVMSVDQKGYQEIRKSLLEVVSSADQTLKKCGDDRVATLNLDLFSAR